MPAVSSAAITIESLRSVSLFAELSDGDLAALAEEVEPRHFRAGEALMEQGGPSDAMFMLRSGRAEVVVTSPRGREQVIDSIGPGELAGELGVVTGGSRTATVRALQPVDALVLRREAFSKVMKGRDFAQRIVLVLADRLAARTRARALEDPPLSRFLFSDTRMAGFWLVLRLWLGPVG